MQKGVQRFAKRASDVVVSGILLLALLPCLALLWLLVKWKLGSPAIFRQPRPGLRGVPFTIYKFRTMTDVRDAAGNLLPDDARMTKFGDLLRSLSLDELPELFNVLTGKMSLVGPRPLRMQYLGRYTAQQMRRHDVPPGITGWAQVNGLRGETSTVDKMHQRIQYDLDYLKNWSLWLDLKIIARTALTFLNHGNAY